MRIKSIILTIAFSIFLSAYSMPCLTLTEKDNGSTVSLRGKQSLKIILPSNISTGYSWNIVSIDTAILEEIGEKEYVQEIKRKGGGGHTIFRFKPAGKGKLSLKLAYCQAWEEGSSYEKTFTVTILVE